MRAGRDLRGLAFDMYGTVVDVGRVAEACADLTPDPAGFNDLWRNRQIQYTFLRTLMGSYRDFWTVTGEALDFALRSFDLDLDDEQRSRLMDAWLEPEPFPDVVAALGVLEDRYRLAILSNGTPHMLRAGLERAGLRGHFQWLISADEVGRFKPSPQVYALGPERMALRRDEILFVSSNPFDVAGAGSFGFRVCWVNRQGAPAEALGSEPELVVTSFEEVVAALE